jgi:hypothetical protein
MASSNLLRQLSYTARKMSADSDHLTYYNGIVINREGRPTAAIIDDIRGQPFLESADAWEMSVIRFDVDTLLLPFAKFPLGARDPAFPNIYYTDLQVNMDGSIGRVIAENTLGEYNDLSLVIRYWNFALQQAFIGLDPAVQAQLLNAPQFYVAPSGKLRLIFPAIWADNSVSKPSIRFNATWAKYLIGFPLWRSDKFGFTPGGQDARIRIEDEAFTIKLPDRTGLPIAFGSTVYGVGGDLAYIEEMFPKPGTLAAVRGITLTTTSIPVNSEILPNAVSIGSQGVSNASSSIISDYLMDTDSYTEQHKIVYLPQAEYRISQLNGHDALRRITIQAWWSDQFGVRYPLMLPINGTFAVKLMFKRRTE